MGLDSITQQNLQGAGLTGIDRLARNSMFPQSQMDRTQYAVSNQLPTSAQTIQSDYDARTNAYTGLPAQPFRAGGIASIPRFDGEDGSQVQAPENDFTFGNPDLNNLSYETLSDSNKIQSLNALKEADPQQYKIELMNALGQSLKDQYNANENYEPTWKQFSELKEVDPAQWNRNQLSWLGHQQGWQIGQNRSERNEAGLPVIQDQIEQSKKAGLSEDEINSILGNSSQSANIQNQNRIINQQKSGGGAMGMTAQDYLTIAAILGGGAAAAYFAPAAGAAGALETAGAAGLTGGGAFVPAAGSGASFTIAPGAYTAAGAAGAGTAGAGTAGASGAGGAAAGGGGSTALNTVRGALLANSLINQLGGSNQQRYSGQGLNPNAGDNAFNPGSAYRSGLPITSGYEKTPWANLMPQITMSKLSEFAPDRGAKEMSGGGQAEADTEEQILKRIRNNIKGSSESNIPRMVEDLLESQRRAELLDKINARFDVPSAQYVEGLGLMTPPPSVSGRLGVNSEAFGGNVRAGLSGNAMMTPDKKILANPGMMDIGYRSSKESEYDPTFDISLQRAIKSMPGRSKDYAVAANYTMPFAQGGIADIGHLGGYSDGGRLLKGPGDGMSDNIPATISNKQPARLADGEFVIPADVVSHLGNGSTDAGAKQLYAMMDRIRKARTGNKKQGKQIKPSKFLPKG